MIQVVMKDGAVVVLDEAEVEIKAVALGEGESERVFTWNDVKRVLLVDMVPGILDGRYGEGMPVRALALDDVSGVRFEVPMAVDDAENLGRYLSGSKVAIAREMPRRIHLPGQ